MSLDTISEMTPKELKRILKCLPRPTDAKVALFGNFDYSKIFHQAQKVVPGIELGGGGSLVFRLENASKEIILNIYTKSYESKEFKPTRKTGIKEKLIYIALIGFMITFKLN